MSMPTNNGYTSTIVSRWEPESPFADEYGDSLARGPAREAEGPPAMTFATESPFLSETEMGGQLAAVDPASEAVAELLGELHDPEMDEAVYELIHEASALASSRLTGELGDNRVLEARVERMLQDHFAPLQRHVEETIERMAEAVAPLDPMSMTEAELESVLDRVEAPAARLSPSFELFAKKMKKKAKSAAKSGVKAAKKGKAKAGPFGILKKIGELVKPLLQKVLAFALDKLPAKYRPLAIKVAERLGLKKPGSGKSKGGAKGKSKGGARPERPLPSRSEPTGDDAGAPLDTASDAGGDVPGDMSGDMGSDMSGDMGGEPMDSGAEPEPTEDVGPATSDADASESAMAAAAEGGALSDVPDESAPDVGQAQSDLDVQIAELVLSESEEEQEATVRAAVVPSRRRDPLGDLDRARGHFIRRVRDLRRGESAAPVVENFIPAILAAVSLGIKVIGRDRVVKFLGGLIGKLIQPLAGKDLAPGLGQAIADIGLKVLFHAEVTVEDTREAAGRAIATTVEETVRRVAALPEHVLENPTLLEAHTLEAFEAAAAASFPPALVRPELREAAGVNATWVSPPGKRAYYRKYSKVFDVEVTPQIASAVKTFEGKPLAAFLRDRLRVAGPSPVRAKVHLYQLLPGGRLSHVAQQDDAPGLGKGDAWRLLHPLTPQAATALISQPRLGTAFPSAPDPLRPSVGQRFYYLEIDGAPAKPVGQATKLRVTADFPKDEIVVQAYIGEGAAQELATALRKGGSPGAAIARLRALLRGEMGVLAGEGSERLFRFVIEKKQGGPEPDTLASAALRALQKTLRKQLGVKVMDWFWARLAEVLQKQTAQFVAATEGPEDGVTILVTLHNPPGLQALRKALRGGAPSSLDAWPPPQLPSATVRFVAGQPE
ncbi:MAG: hypothetical protein U0441_39160 [Polyangiaceae bacterium]